MVRAARDADHGQEAPGRHAQRLASGLDEECLLSVGQVFRVCARLFSQQLQRALPDRDLDVEFPLLPSLPLDIGVQLVQTGLELRHFPLHRRQRIRRTGRVRRVRSHGRLDGRLLGFHDGPSFPGSGHSRLLGFREHLPFPFSHSRVLHAQFGGRLTRFQPSGRDRDHRLAFQLLGDRTVPQLALAGRELVDPRHEQFLAFRIAEHPHGAAGPSAVFEVMVHRGPFLPVRVPPVAFPAPGGNAGALLLEPVRVPRQQHALAGIAELADHVGGAAFVFDVQVHGPVALLPAVLRHEGVLLPVRESKKTSPPRENDSVYSFFIGDGNHCVGITLHKVQNPIDPDGKVYFPRSFQYYARGIESMKDFADKLDVSSITLVPVPSPVDTKPVRHRKRKK